jgi:hypothetical protein
VHISSFAASRLWRFVSLAIAAGVVGFSWVLRYNEPEGSYAGLLDDHYFYVVRGWQMLWGELPDRDFVDIGAPLTFALSAAAQLVIGRGAWAEILLAVTMLSIAAGLSYYAAERASGSILAAGAATLFQVALFPRFYNYPKLITYAFAIPVTWAVLDRPTLVRRAALAVITVLSLLLRHDHGVFIGIFVVSTILFTARAWRDKIREVLIYAALVFALTVPYLVYLAVNGGVITHFVTANAWSMRDRSRAPLKLPGFVMPAAESLLNAPWTFAQVNVTAWLFYLLVLLPFVVFALLAWSRDAWRPDWPHARAKMAGVALLALILNVGFLRGALSARLADVMVPHTTLVAWLLVVAATLLWRGRVNGADGNRPVSVAARVGLSIATFVVAAITAAAVAPGLQEGLRDSHVGLDPGAIVGRAQEITGRFRETWPLERWTSPDSRGPIKLAFYFEACTDPADRVFVSQYLPQVPALSRRAFAGGHPDLRPGFFATEAHQQLFLERIRTESVPVLVVPPPAEYGGFAEAFPQVAEYFAAHYDPAGERDLDDGLHVAILTRRDRQRASRYEPLDLPCFR